MRGMRKNGGIGRQPMDAIKGEQHFFRIHLQKHAEMHGEVCVLQIQAAALLCVPPLSLLT